MMKKLQIVLILLLNFQFGFAQIEGPEPPPGTLCEGPQPPPPSGGPCDICNSLLEWNIYTCEYVEGLAYEECVEANCAVLAPMSYNVTLLFLAGIFLGLYFVIMKHKKRPLEN